MIPAPAPGLNIPRFVWGMPPAESQRVHQGTEVSRQRRSLGITGMREILVESVRVDVSAILKK